MSAQRLEALLARLLVDGEVRARFLAHPEAEGLRAGLTGDELRALPSIDRAGLELAARSVAGKRRARRPWAKR